MNLNLRSEYHKKAISQIPRILGNMDRSNFSVTYGSLHRDYWLDKTSDFSDAVRQFGVHGLALVYKYKFSNNIYYQNENILSWVVAGMEFWASIQHKDGSFDEFYPYERGWVGPTAFTTFSIIEAYKLVKENISNKKSEKILNAIYKSAIFIGEGDKEEDHLANHHAMACLSLWKSYTLFNEKRFYKAFQQALDNFKKYHNFKEGWSIEYDGIDPGYLSATVSFFGKIFKDNKNEEIFDICNEAIKACSYFVLPNGFYGGSIGSRNTQHFYPHGFEIFGGHIPLSLSIADKMLYALKQGKLVPPEIISDRYLVYRVPEYLESYLDYTPRIKSLPKLPYEKSNLNFYFKDAKVWIKSDKNFYFVVNAAKGGVLKLFDKNKLIFSDSGIIGKTNSGKLATTQWIDKSYIIKKSLNKIVISGKLNQVPSNKNFNLYKNLLFRLTLLFIGWSPKLSHSLKGMIRKVLMLGNRRLNIKFKRTINFDSKKVNVTDQISLDKKVKFNFLSFGSDFFVRYVPQSRYFQSQELFESKKSLNKTDLKKLNQEMIWTNKTNIKLSN